MEKPKTWAQVAFNRIGRVTAWICFLGLLYIGLTSSFLYRGLADIERSHAAVNKIEGVFVFVESTPLQATEYLGTVKAGVTWSGDFKEVIAKLIKKAKKEYPTAEGIIFNGQEKADVIKFK